jgi:hypothetical protein
MKDFLYTKDAKTIETLKLMGCPLFTVDDDLYIFINTPSIKEFIATENKNMKLIKMNKVYL